MVNNDQEEPAVSAVEATREPNFLLARHEKRVLTAIARRVPRWILPDDMTALGVASAIGICIAYVATNADRSWMWAATVLLVVHWLAHSLHGTLARVRGIERPRCGYYLDHLVDAISTACIGIGLGLSPFMLLSTGALIVVAYLMLSINVYLESYALGRFAIGYGRIGPTEVRVLLIALNVALALGAGLGFHLGGIGMNAFDLVGLAVAAVMCALMIGRAIANLRRLAREEPAASRA